MAVRTLLFAIFILSHRRAAVNKKKPPRAGEGLSLLIPCKIASRGRLHKLSSNFLQLWAGGNTSTVPWCPSPCLSPACGKLEEMGRSILVLHILSAIHPFFPEVDNRHLVTYLHGKSHL